jgi:hypothetical protein
VLPALTPKPMSLCVCGNKTAHGWLDCRLKNYKAQSTSPISSHLFPSQCHCLVGLLQQRLLLLFLACHHRFDLLQRGSHGG